MSLLNRIVFATGLVYLALLPGWAQNISTKWTPSGYGGGGRFTAIAIDSNNPQYIFIGSDVAGIFRSRDGGNTFALTGRGLQGFCVADIAINPKAPHQVMSLTDGGLHYSPSQGDDWIRLSDQVRYSSRYSGSKLLLFTQQSLWIGTDKNGVFKLPVSNFQSKPEPVSGLESFQVNGLAVYDGYLYAGTSNGVFRLADGTWNIQSDGLPPDSLNIVDIASAQNNLYLLEKYRGLFRWSQSFRTWEHVSISAKTPPKAYKTLLVHPANSKLVFVGSHPENWPHQIFKTVDSGMTWKSIQSFQMDSTSPPNWTRTFTGAEEIAWIPGSTADMFLSDWWNVWQSSDTGENWNQKHKGLQNTVVNDLKIHPQNPSLLYLCAADNGLMLSRDAGKNWKRAMNGVADGHAQEIEISPHDPSRMVLLMNPWGKKGRVYVYESRDSGVNWRDIGFSTPDEPLPRLGYVDGLSTNVELDPLSDDTIYIGTNGYGIFKTINGGKDWVRMNKGLMTPYIKGPGALRVHPIYPTTLFASTQAGGIYKSTNGANTWQRVTTGERFTFGMAIDPVTPSRIVAGCAGNTLLITNDEGKTWQETRIPVPRSPQLAVYGVAFHPKRPGLILAGTIRYDVRATEGLLISMDNAQTFQQMKMDIPKVNINTITLTKENPVSGYIGFNGTGLFRIELGEIP
jgi:photosystem II stability/assembly factor-like uncharacterized protein